MRPSERPSRLALMDKSPKRKAPLTRLPEHLPKLKQYPHPHRRVCGSTPRKALSPEVLAKIDTVHWRVAEVAWALALVPKGHQTRPHRVGAGIESSSTSCRRLICI